MEKKIVVLYLFEDYAYGAFLQKDGKIIKASVDMNLEQSPYEAATSLAAKMDIDSADLVICPGGVGKPLKPGTYEITDQAVADMREARYGEHPYNRLTLICRELGSIWKAVAVMAAPMSCDELLPLNRCTSHSYVDKHSRYYACEHLAAISEYAFSHRKRPEELNIIAVRIDDDVSVGAYRKGQCIDVNDVVGQEGPMGFTSSGDIPVAQLVMEVSDAEEKRRAVAQTIKEKSGILGYTGTKDPVKLEMMIGENDEQALLAVKVLTYQTGKWIGSSAMQLGNEVDAVLITGKGIKSKTIVELLQKRTGKIAPIHFMDVDMDKYLYQMAKMLGTKLYPIYKY